MAIGDGRPVRASRISYDLKDPPTHRRAVREIGEAVSVSRGNVVHAAEALGVSHSQLVRWIGQYPVLKLHVAKIRKRFGHVDRTRKS